MGLARISKEKTPSHTSVQNLGPFGKIIGKGRFPSNGSAHRISGHALDTNISLPLFLRPAAIPGPLPTMWFLNYLFRSKCLLVFSARDRGRVHGGRRILAKTPYMKRDGPRA